MRFAIKIDYKKLLWMRIFWVISWIIGRQFGVFFFLTFMKKCLKKLDFKHNIINFNFILTVSLPHKQNQHCSSSFFFFVSYLFYFTYHFIILKYIRRRHQNKNISLCDINSNRFIYFFFLLKYKYTTILITLCIEKYGANVILCQWFIKRLSRLYIYT